MEKVKSKGPWFHRLAIHFFTVVLGVIFYWLLGFLVMDIRSIDGPDYQAFEAQRLDQQLVEKSRNLEKQISDLELQINNQKELQSNLGDSSAKLEQTIARLIQIQEPGPAANAGVPETEKATFKNSLDLFLENQRKYQELSQTVFSLLQQQQILVQSKTETDAEIEARRVPIREEYNEILRQHTLKLAFFQLGLLVPVLAIATVLVLKKRESIYFPMFLAFGVAALIRVALVMHEYFPTEYFKYILIIALLLAVARVLIYFIRTIAFPKRQWLVTQYRQAYERFLCPICEYPIRTGPRRYLFWTRRTIKKLSVSGDSVEEEPYTCPSCGSGLFEACSGCGKVRHVLLPHCSHCGLEKSVE
jgi:hypothetical protein